MNFVVSDVHGYIFSHEENYWWRYAGRTGFDAAARQHRADELCQKTEGWQQQVEETRDARRFVEEMSVL